jgi:C4-dicarboxylate-specific signal transduction histidine kinase
MNAATSEAADSQSDLVRSNKLDLLERLADDLAHEIKNPLHSLVINLEVLKRRISRVGEQQADDMLRYVGVLDGELARVNRRVELLLRLVRPGRQSDELALSEIIDDLVELMQLESNRRKVAFHYEPHAAAARVQLPVDAGRQIVLNLVLAMLDRVPSDDTLSLECTSLEGHVRFLARGAPLAGLEVVDPADERLTVVRALCARTSARLIEDGDETPGDRIGITIPIPPR